MSIKLGGGQKLSSSTFSSTLHCRVEGRPLEDSRLLFTGPSPFGWHRYESFLKCPSQYGWNYGENPLPSFDAQGALVPAIRNTSLVALAGMTTSLPAQSWKLPHRVDIQFGGRLPTNF